MDTIIIAEKKSVGQAICDVLSGTKSHDKGFITVGDNTVVTWARGHLMRFAEPDELDERFKNWRVEDLPILPTHLPVLPSDDGDERRQLSIVIGLLKDAKKVIHAGDAGREGQLIVDLIIQHAKFKGEVKRLWLNANDADSVRKALKSVEPNENRRSLYEAGIARTYADWYQGMNLSRAYTLMARKGGYVHVVSIGRVQTPTLLLVVARDLEIANFKPQTFYVPTVTVNVKNGSFQAEWKLPEDKAGIVDGKLLDATIGERLIVSVDGQPGKIAQLDVELQKLSPPLPYKLSTLTKDASSRFKMSGDRTLAVAQSLYDKKLTSYPRTGSCHLKEAMHAEAPQTLAAIAENDPKLAQLIAGANTGLRAAAWNDKKVGEHHGIIPVRGKSPVSDLTEEERQLYDLICRRYIALFYPNAQVERTRVVVEVATRHSSETFIARGNVEKDPGWRRVFNDPAEDEEAGATPSLPIMSEGEVCKIDGVELQRKQTRPPSPYNDGTLTGDMEEIHKVFKSGKLADLDPMTTQPELIQRIKETAGLGTDATRANIIGTLEKRGFVERKNKVQIISTETGRALIQALPTKVKSPALTALFEQELESIVAGSRSAADFLEKQRQWTKGLVEEALKAPLIMPKLKGDINCPSCKLGILVKRHNKSKKEDFFGCSLYPECRSAYPCKRGKPDLEAKPIPAR